jgi:hypothetical protein
MGRAEYYLGERMMFQMSKINKYLFLLLVVAIAIIPINVVHADSEIKVIYEGEQLAFDVSPVIESGTTLVQFRPIFEKLGLKILWDAKSKRIQGLQGDKTIVDMYLNNKSVTANNKAMTLDVAPKLSGDYTMVPLRFLSEASGKMVTWDDSSRTITIGKGYEKDVIINPIGGDSFIKLEDLKDNQNIKANIYEKDGYVFSSWMGEYTANNILATRMFSSIEKDGVWQSKNAPIYWKVKNTAAQYLSFFADGSYFTKDDKEISRITPGKDGSNSDISVIASVYSVQGSLESIRPIYVDGKASVLYRQSYSTSYGTTVVNTVTTQICYGNGSPVTVQDPHNLIASLPITTILYYNSTTKIMYLIEGESYRMLDITSGDLRYASDGKTDLITKFVTDSRAGSTQHYFYNGTMYSLYFDTNGVTYRFYTVDKDMVASVPIITQITQKDLQNKTLTFTDNSIRLWSFYDYNRSPAIQLLQYSK